MTIQEVYEKYKHMDELFSRPSDTEDEVNYFIIHDLWVAIKEQVKENKTQHHHL